MRRRRLREAKGLLMANSRVKDETQVPQGSTAHACACPRRLITGCELSAEPTLLGLMDMADLQRPPPGGILSPGLRRPGLASYNGGTTLLAKYCPG